MSYVSLKYYILVVAALVLYYIFPLKFRWIVLLAGSVAFYYLFCKTGWWIFLITIAVSYIVGILLDRITDKWRKVSLTVGIVSVVTPWLLIKNGNFIFVSIFQQETVNWIVPLGISFYTLQMIAYMVDVFKKKISPEVNPAKYILFISFFPQLIQGPIPRYGQLQHQLIQGHKFEEKNFVKGFYYILWGFFLKLVIADKAGVIVDTVFAGFPKYSGFYVWIASFLYSIQLYTDFLACTTLAQGVSKLFGINLADNFARPYFAVSIKDFWRRWHISLSSWFRDYIYIPLGGNRYGKLRKNLNLIVTFLVSGIWHGAGYKFIFWGLLHAGYQIAGDLTYEYREKAYGALKIERNSKKKKLLRQIITFFMVNCGWIIFRADSLTNGLRMIKHMITDFNPWVLVNDRMLTLGLGWKELIILVVAIFVLWNISRRREQGYSISEKIMSQCLPIRWAIYIIAILAVIIVGTYGHGFNAQDFIYGGF